MNPIVRYILLAVVDIGCAALGGLDIGKACEAFKSGEYYRFGIYVMLSVMFIGILLRAVFCFNV